MSSISSNVPTLTSYSVADPASGQTWRVTRPNTSEQATDTEPAVARDPHIQRQPVTLSQEALQRFQAYTENRQAAAGAGTGLVLSEGVALDVPAPFTAEERAEMLLDITDPMELQLKRLEQKWEKLDLANDDLRGATRRAESSYLSFLDQLAVTDADLFSEGRSFGFSVNASGQLVVTQAQGLSQSQVDRLTQALNASDTLVADANRLADAHIAVFEAESFHSKGDFNRESYAGIVDIGTEIVARHQASFAARDGSDTTTHQNNWNNNWRQQVWGAGIRG